MGVVLAILKIIGIILLILLGLILVILLSVLFIPICYRAEMEKLPKSINSDASVSWFFGAIKVCVGFTWSKGAGRKVTKDLRLFGISLFRIRNYFRARKKRRAEKARQAYRRERIRKLEELKKQDPEAFEKERRKALERKRERRAKKAEAAEAPDTAGGPEAGFAEQSSPDILINADVPDAKQAALPSEELQAAGHEEDPTSFRAEDFEALETPPAAETKGKGSGKGRPSLRKRISELMSMDVTSRAKTVTKKLRGRVRSVFVKRGLRIKAMKAGISKKESAEGGSGISGKSFDARLQSLNDKLDDLAIKLLDLLDDLPIRVTSFLIGLPRRIFGLLSRVFGKVTYTIAILRKVVNFVQDPRTRAFIRMAMRTLRKFLHHVFPRRIRGFLHYGFSDPSWTGISLGAWSIVAPQVRGGFRLEPEFEDVVFEGEADLRGRIFLFYILFLGLRAYLNKNTKFVIRFMREMSKEARSSERGRTAAQGEENVGEVA